MGTRAWGLLERGGRWEAKDRYGGKRREQLEGSAVHEPERWCFQPWSEEEYQGEEIRGEVQGFTFGEMKLNVPWAFC